MSGGWQGSNRGAELPDNWPDLRRAQLEADGGQCVWILPSGRRCPHPATDVDHYGKPWEHDKLRSLCSVHHDKRSSKQGNAAKAALWKAPPRKPPQRHPGRI